MRNGEYRWAKDGGLVWFADFDTKEQQLKCRHNWNWNIKVGVPCTAAEEEAVSGFWYCDCQTHAEEEGRSGDEVCERPYTAEELEAALLLVKLQGG